MEAWRVVVKAVRDGREDKAVEQTFTQSPLTIGAAPENDLVLAHAHVSSSHAHLVVSRGSLVLYDHSRNGTLVNGDRVVERALKDGDVVGIPPFQLRVQLHLSADTRRTSILDPGLDTAAVSLEVKLGPASLLGKTLPVPPTGLRIGRSADCEMAVDLATLSRVHAEIRPNPAGGWVARDLGSVNGTFVNGQRIKEHPLGPGDEVCLATDLCFMLVAPHADTAPSPPPVPPPPPRLPTQHPQPKEQVATDTALPGARTLKIDTQRAGKYSDVLVLSLAGRVDGYNYTELGQALDGVVDSGEMLVIVDLSQLQFIDHTGLGVLVKASAAVEQAGGQLRLCGLSQRLSESFSLSRLDSFFGGKVLPDRHAAIADLDRYLR